MLLDIFFRYMQWDYGKFILKLVYLNGNNAAEGENNIKYANSYPMNWTVKNWFAQDMFESLCGDRKWIEIVIGLGTLWDWIDIACKYPFIHQVPVVQKLNNAIPRINHYPVDSVVCFVNTYPLDSDLSGG